MEFREVAGAHANAVRKTPPGALSGPEVRQIRKAAREFESIFLHHLLKTMRQAGTVGQPLLGGMNQKVYQDLMDDELAKAISRSGGIGLADLLVRDLSRRQATEKKISSPDTPGPMQGAVGRETGGGDDR